MTSTQTVEALRKLAAEVGGLKAFEPGVREAIGNTNWTVLMQRLDEAGAALSCTALASERTGRALISAYQARQEADRAALNQDGGA